MQSAGKRFEIVSGAGDSDLMFAPQVIINVIDNQIVVTNNSEEDCTVSVYDAAGKLVLKGMALPLTTTYVENSRSLASGVYLVNVRGTQSVNKTERVVIR